MKEGGSIGSKLDYYLFVKNKTIRMIVTVPGLLVVIMVNVYFWRVTDRTDWSQLDWLIFWFVKMTSSIASGFFVASALSFIANLIIHSAEKEN